MYTVDHTFGYRSKKVICACAKSSAHSTEIRGGLNSLKLLTCKVPNRPQVVIQGQGRFTKCGSAQVILPVVWKGYKIFQNYGTIFLGNDPYLVLWFLIIVLCFWMLCLRLGTWIPDKKWILRNIKRAEPQMSSDKSNNIKLLSSLWGQSRIV